VCFSDEVHGRQEVYMCLAALFADLRINGGAFSSSELPGKNTSIHSELLTLKLGGLKRKERKV